jgi:hypothetical protein
VCEAGIAKLRFCSWKPLLRSSSVQLLIGPPCISRACPGKLQRWARSSQSRTHLHLRSTLQWDSILIWVKHEMSVGTQQCSYLAPPPISAAFCLQMLGDEFTLMCGSRHWYSRVASNLLIHLFENWQRPTLQHAVPA